MTKKMKAAVFASGTGTNAENIMRFAAERVDEIEIVALVCDQPDAAVQDKAAKYGVPVLYVPFDREGFADYAAAKQGHEKRIRDALAPYDADWLLLAGYMRILSPAFLAGFYDETRKINRVVNIHPSLLPSFAGPDGYGDAFRAGVKIAGVTVHFVDDGIDTGPILIQKPFERCGDDTLDDFKARGLALEYQAYIEALEYLMADRVRLVTVEGTDRKMAVIRDADEDKLAKKGAA